jgi:hypothetical protein
MAKMVMMFISRYNNVLRKLVAMPWALDAERPEK